eukprot:TRINITY_DN30772_c0_g1_i1.p1 TRINITY_DN30772_c0_g1~~TRINITY_DN30772_c0_g1_i1.p1  ORF type:complete len:360 (-),score=60.08 TRINITY_DN30772_c0_g1_i1:145-1188(-)
MRADDVEQPLLPVSESLLSAAGGGSGGELGRLVFLKRRPVHPGRFVDFLQRRCGPFEEIVASDDAPWAAAAGSELALRERGTENGARLGALCRRRRPASQAKAPWRPTDSDDALLHGWSVRQASGCVWFAGSDGCRVEWGFDAGEGAGGTRLRRHSLQTGVPWEIDPADQTREAGERRVELVLDLEHTRDRKTALSGFIAGNVAGAETAMDESSASGNVDVQRLQAAKERLLAELQHCLLTRLEAMEWDRRPHEDTSSWATEKLMIFVELTTRVVSALPGYSLAAATGEAAARRVARVLGHDVEGTGRTDGTEEEDDLREPLGGGVGVPPTFPGPGANGRSARGSAS